MSLVRASTLQSLVVTFALVSSGAAVGNNPVPTLLRAEWIGYTPDNGILVSDILLAAHDGELVLKEDGQPVSEPLVDVVSALATQGIEAALNAAHVAGLDAAVHGLYNYPFPVGGIGTPRPGGPQQRQTMLFVQRDQHRYLSYLAAIKPSNDAFVGNDDPKQFELFDADGRFQGPLVIDLFGSQAVDAGLCDNDEIGLRLLDDTAGTCAGGEGTVRPHPGLNGSRRNPDGEPQRVLGGQFAIQGRVIRYDVDAADFTVPGYRLGRLLITDPRALRWHVAGSWYNPSRAGEGFNLEVVKPAEAGGPQRLLVYWYTFEPDHSGKQVWLAGMGDLSTGTTRVPLHRTEGGRFASTDNPDLAERTPWGHVDLTFTSCFHGVMQYAPLDANWPEGGYAIHRLGPLPEGVDWQCLPQ